MLQLLLVVNNRCHYTHSRCTFHCLQCYGHALQRSRCMRLMKHKLLVIRRTVLCSPIVCLQRLQLSAFDEGDSGVLSEWALEEFLKALVPELPPLEGMEVRSNHVVQAGVIYS